LTLQGHTDEISAAAYSPDGKRIVSASEDKTLKIWDAHSGEELSTLRGHADNITCVAFSPDGKRVASGSRGVVKLWDVADVGVNAAR
jgi:WD40 repeat protein